MGVVTSFMLHTVSHFMPLSLKSSIVLRYKIIKLSYLFAGVTIETSNIVVMVLRAKIVSADIAVT